MEILQCPQKTLEKFKWVGHGKSHAQCSLKQMKVVLQQSKFISINCDEVTILDNQCWISMHANVVEIWRM